MSAIISNLRSSKHDNIVSWNYEQYLEPNQDIVSWGYQLGQSYYIEDKLDFQKGNSTGHATIYPSSWWNHEALEQNKCTLGVFIDLSKAFDITDFQGN